MACWTSLKNLFCLYRQFRGRLNRKSTANINYTLSFFLFTEKDTYHTYIVPLENKPAFMMYNLRWTKLIVHRISYVTFDRNKIESRGFHRWKEQIKSHRIMLQTFWTGFSKVFNWALWKTTFLIGDYSEFSSIGCAVKAPIEDL
jgi:hypothetical protein